MEGLPSAVVTASGIIVLTLLISFSRRSVQLVFTFLSVAERHLMSRLFQVGPLLGLHHLSFNIGFNSNRQCLLHSHRDVYRSPLRERQDRSYPHLFQLLISKSVRIFVVHIPFDHLSNVASASSAAKQKRWKSSSYRTICNPCTN
jgi:hypothetical protein